MKTFQARSVAMVIMLGAVLLFGANRLVTTDLYSSVSQHSSTLSVAHFSRSVRNTTTRSPNPQKNDTTSWVTSTPDGINQSHQQNSVISKHTQLTVFSIASFIAWLGRFVCTALHFAHLSREVQNPTSTRLTALIGAKTRQTIKGDRKFFVTAVFFDCFTALEIFSCGFLGRKAFKCNVSTPFIHDVFVKYLAFVGWYDVGSACLRIYHFMRRQRYHDFMFPWLLFPIVSLCLYFGACVMWIAAWIHQRRRYRFLTCLRIRMFFAESETTKEALRMIMRQPLRLQTLVMEQVHGRVHVFEIQRLQTNRFGFGCLVASNEQEFDEEQVAKQILASAKKSLHGLDFTRVHIASEVVPANSELNPSVCPVTSWMSSYRVAVAEDSNSMTTRSL